MNTLIDREDDEEVMEEVMDGDYEKYIEDVLADRILLTSSDKARDTPEDIFFKQATEILLDIFKEKASITIIEKGLYLVKIDELDLEFKTNLMGFEYFRDVANIMETIIQFSKDGTQGNMLKGFLEGPIESISNIEIKKNRFSESITIIITIQEQLINGGYKDTRKEVLSLYNFSNVNYEYVMNNKLIKDISIEELSVLHNKLLGKIYTGKIKSSPLIYATVLETIDDNFDESGIPTRFTFSILSPSESFANNLRDLFKYVGFYDVEFAVKGIRSLDRDDWDEEDLGFDNEFKPIDEEELNFSKIYGLDTIKREFEILGELMKYKYENKKVNVEIPKGVLLIGDPGTGKTYITKAFAKQYNFDIFYLSDSVGSSGLVDSGTIKRCFEKAAYPARYSPVIIFIDEIDKIITKNNEQVMSTLLEKLSNESNFLVIGACNNEDSLPAPLTRPGRFDKKMYFGSLSAASKVSIFKQILEKKEVYSPDLDIVSIIDYLPGHITVATLDAIAKQAKVLKTVLKEEINTIKMIDIAESLMDGISEVVRPDEEGMKRTAWHEAGHATLALLLDRKITLATIKPSYNWMGYVMYKIEEEQSLVYKDYVKMIQTSIGGWAAEKLVFKDLSVGASADFQGMQSIINFLTSYTGDSGTHLISTNPYLNINSSGNERNDTYRVKKSKTKKYIKTSVNLLKKHKVLLNKVYEALMLKERVSGPELEKIYEDYLKEKDKKK